MKHARLLVIGLVALQGGCIQGASRSVAPNSTAASWQMPWQFAPVSYAPANSGEHIVSSDIPGTGYVTGTPEALASIGHDLPHDPRPNRTVATCQKAVAGEAAKQGAKEIDAASAGPEQITPDGNVKAPVLIRVVYPRARGYDVRVSTMTCITKPDASIVDAFVVAPGSSRYSSLR